MKIEKGFLAVILLALAIPALAAAAATTITVDPRVRDAMTNFQIRAALLDKLGTDALHIHIDVHGGAVKLTGAVEKSDTRDRARGIASSIDGVTRVENDIALRGGGTPPSGANPKIENLEKQARDALLEASVAARLLGEIGRHALDVKVEARSGVVTLSGTAPNAAYRDMAVQTANRTKGVARVVDSIRVAPEKH
jgi:osmotically-inducible protein OsmY